ncbi:elongation factor P 5-aminopentanone reductase [Jeotgalibacillus malaysiensis]|uniref:elongation factor P 5-aminopentanone reductase n=1 Tax=Jeotgalibacillus malaysiensis TaxID=1508404 RepID=UPI0038514D17
MGKIALVLGSSGGIGFEICKKLLQTDHTVLAQYYSNKDAINGLSQFASQQGHLVPLKLDLTDGAAVDQVVTNLLQPDMIIHAGGQHFEGLFEDTPDHVIENLWNVHLYQPARMIRRLIPGMRHKDGASIVFVSSIWGEAGASYEVMYSAVKGAQISFVKALGKELAPNGIRVNAVAPGAVSTTMTAHYDAKVRRDLEGEIPAGRFARPEEIADAVMFLTGKQSTYINGHVLSVNGGWYS